MKDSLFIERMMQGGKEADDKVRSELDILSLQQLNWKPAADSWSVGQCLDHLIVSDCLYFPTFRKIAEGQYKMSNWQRWSPLSGLFGKILVDQVQENVKKKLKAPKVFKPSTSQIDAGVLDRFHKHLDTLREYIAAVKEINIDRIHITSPAAKFVTFSLRNAVTLLIQHEHRHINQALRVKAREGFPK